MRGAGEYLQLPHFVVPILRKNGYSAFEVLMFQRVFGEMRPGSGTVVSVTQNELALYARCSERKVRDWLEALQRLPGPVILSRGGWGEATTFDLQPILEMLRKATETDGQSSI